MELADSNGTDSVWICSIYVFAWNADPMEFFPALWTMMSGGPGYTSTQQALSDFCSVFEVMAGSSLRTKSK